MSQHDGVIDDAAGIAFLADLNLLSAALMSNNAGPTEPATKYAYMWWPDTTANILKQRNAANNAWISRFTLTLAMTAFGESLAQAADANAVIALLGNPGVPTASRIAYDDATLPTGYIWASGRTIGSAASGATERANADCQTLYTKYWNSFANSELAVTGGRGASAAADWAANKPIAVPDLRGRVSVGKDDMGGTAANRVTSGASGIVGITLGKSGGGETHTLTTAQMPAHAHGLNGAIMDDGGVSYNVSGGGRGSAVYATASQGSGNAHNNMQPSWITNYIIKL